MCGYSCDCCVRECAVTVVIVVYESVRLQLCCCVRECPVTVVIVVWCAVVYESVLLEKVV